MTSLYKILPLCIDVYGHRFAISHQGVAICERCGLIERDRQESAHASGGNMQTVHDDGRETPTDAQMNALWTTVSPAGGQPVTYGIPTEVPDYISGDHHYVSTACWHAIRGEEMSTDQVAALHNRCRKQCKFCAELCLCRCHEKDQSKGTGVI